MGAGCSSGTDALPMGGPLNQRFGFDGPSDAAVGCYDPEWRNYFEEIFAAQEGGEQAYQELLRTQDQLFKRGTEKGKVGDELELKVDTAKYTCLFAVAELDAGRRGTHSQGLGLSGQAKVDPDPKIPESDFFKPGRLFEVRARHSSFPFCDDHTKLCIPSLAVKFADQEEGGPLDLICQSGRSSNFFCSDSISDLMEGVRGSSEDFKKYLLKLPIYLATFIENIRILPDSLHHIYYHAQTVFHFKPNDGKLRLARFRIVPADGSRESGRLTKDQQMDGEVWNLDSRADANQKAKYLFNEMKDRIKKGSVEYQIQMQLYQPEGNSVNRYMYNATIPWKESMCPWLNLMTLTLDSLLGDDVCEITRYNIGNLCDPLSIPGTDSDDNFNAVPNIRKTVYSSACSQRLKEIDPPKGKGVTYQITTETGDKLEAGTDSEISISLIGTSGRTPFKPLDKLGINDHEKGSCRTYDFKASDIGELLCAKITTKRAGAFADWYLDHVKVKYQVGKKQQSYFLPCYRWFTEKVPSLTLTDGTAKLPHQEKHTYMTLQRQMELQDQQELYQWRGKAEDPGMEDYPGFIAAGDDSSALPRDARFDKEREQEIAFDGIKNKLDEVAANIRSAIADAFKKDRDPFKAKSCLLAEDAKSETLNYVMEHWKEDEEFGRQVLQGMLPMKITRVDELPENFAVEDEAVKDQLEGGKTLETEIKAKKVYMINFSELSGFADCGKGKHLSDPICLLYVCKGKLIPIAIKVSKDSPIFTKKDDQAEDKNISDWLMAKIWVKVAEINYHQHAEHLMGTHLIAEAFGIATVRNFASSHPIYKLIRPHLHFTSAINTTARKILLPDGQILSRMFALGSKPGNHLKFAGYFYKEHLCLETLHVPKNIEKRNVKDNKQLPGYFYRDDALKLWEAIMAVVKEILDICYKKDSDVTDDTELQAFMTDLRTNGLHANFGLPDPLDKKQQLYDLLTAIIFRASCGHAAVNFGQLDLFGFTPNAPTHMRCPPPTQKTPKGFTPEDVREKMLPEDTNCSGVIATATLLAAFSENERYLGDYPEQLFTEKKVLDAVGRFQKKLKEISSAIKKRNKTLPVPYNYLNPEQIPNSVAV